MSRAEELTDEQWNLIESLLPTVERADKRRPTSNRGSGRIERHFLDIAYWRSMGRLAGTLSFVPDLPPTLPGVGQLGHRSRRCWKPWRRTCEVEASWICPNAS